MATRKKVDAITGRRKTSRKPTVKEELTGFNTKTGKANTVKRALLKGLTPIDIRRRGGQSVLEGGARKVFGGESRSKAGQADADKRKAEILKKAKRRGRGKPSKKR